MQQHFFGTNIPSLTVSGFLQYNEEQLAAFAAQPGLSLNTEVLGKAQRLLRTARHVPTVAELQLLEALSDHLPRYGTNAAITSLDTANGNEARIWQDMMQIYRTQTASSAAPPTLRDLPMLSAKALAKAARLADPHALFCGTTAAAQAAFASKAPLLSLNLGAVALAAAEGIRPKELPEAGHSVLAVRTVLPAIGNDVITKFFARYAAYKPLALAAIGEEGLGAHLSSLPTGVEFDLATMHVDNATQLLIACRHTVLVAMPPQCAAAVLAEGAPATLIGHIIVPPVLALKHGPVSLTRLPQRVLEQWQPTLCCTTCRETPQTASDTHLTANQELVLGGVSYTGNHLTPLLLLLRDVCLAGGDMHGATLSVALSLPPASLCDAISPLLAYHRFTAELALPTASAQILYNESLTTPTVTVGMLAPKRRTVTKERSDALQAALACGNFSLLREAIYQK